MNKLKDYKTTDKGEWREFEIKSDELKVLNKIITNIEGLENACKEFKELNPNSPEIHKVCNTINLRGWFELLSMSISIDKGKKVSVQ
jgi:hypothetical protein